MTPTRPYFLRAIYEWIVDNGCTPFLAVNADGADVFVPRDYVDNGQITLNVAPDAIANLVMANDSVTFNARFSGTPYQIHLPMASILGIYARENGQGMAFPEEYVQASETSGDATPSEGDDDSPEPPSPSGPSGGKPKLKVVK